MMTSVAEELQAAARAIRSTPDTDSFHREVAVLLDQIALSAPLVEMQLPPITRKALDVARAFQQPTRAADNGDQPAPQRCQYCGHKVAQIFDVGGAWCGDEHRRFDRANEETWWRKSGER